MPSRSEREISELQTEVTRLKVLTEELTRVNGGLRHNLSQQLRSEDRMFWTDGGVNEDGKPFVTIRWGDQGAQMGTDEVRDFAMTLIQTADAAEYDAALIAGGRGAEMDEQTVGALVAMAREFRNVQADSAGGTKTETTPIKKED